MSNTPDPFKVRQFMHISVSELHGLILNENLRSTRINLSVNATAL